MKWPLRNFHSRSVTSEGPTSQAAPSALRRIPVPLLPSNIHSPVSSDTFTTDSASFCLNIGTTAKVSPTASVPCTELLRRASAYPSVRVRFASICRKVIESSVTFCSCTIMVESGSSGASTFSTLFFLPLQAAIDTINEANSK